MNRTIEKNNEGNVDFLGNILVSLGLMVAFILFWGALLYVIYNALFGNSSFNNF